MIISLRDLAIRLGCSRHTVIKIKRNLGYKKGVVCTTDQIPELQEELTNLRNRNVNPDMEKLYKQVYKKILSEGYITQIELLKVFHMNNIDQILCYFENNDMLLYEDKIKVLKANKKEYNVSPDSVKYKYITVYKSPNKEFGLWAKERMRDNGQPGGFVRTNQRRFI